MLLPQEVIDEMAREEEINMVSEKRAINLIRQCLNELYMNSEPPISWEECESRYTEENEWWMLHKIDSDTYDEIVSKYKKMIGSLYRGLLEMALLSYAPTTREE